MSSHLWSISPTILTFSFTLVTMVTPFSAPHITRALLPPNGCPSHKLWWWHCKKPRPAFGWFSRLSYPQLEHICKYLWLSLDFWLEFLHARYVFLHMYINICVCVCLQNTQTINDGMTNFIHKKNRRKKGLPMKTTAIGKRARSLARKKIKTSFQTAKLS